MNIHEYQGKEILARYGIKIPQGRVASNLQEAEAAVQAIGPGPFVVKAQVHAGGRGKGGGIRRAKDRAEVTAIAREMLGSNLITPQSGAQGKPINRVLVEESLPIESELYLGVTIDRGQGKAAVIGCSEGGMEIEEIGERSPEKIHKITAEPGCGFTLYQGRKLAMDMGLKGSHVGKGAAAAVGLFRVFMENDCSLAEINPLVLTVTGDIVALDCKMNIDDSALYRHPEIAALRDITQEDPRDVEAARLNLNYINLSGNIGCVVNGAGLGMATMDILRYYGGEPANFLDAGAGANEDKIRNAFVLILSDPKVKGILVNMFGGITRCDSYAKGIVDGVQGRHLTLPFVIRMEGTNVELGRKILAESDLNVTYADTMQEAAQKIVQLVKKE